MTKTAHILVVEDDGAMRESCVKLFRLQGYAVCEASSAAEALDCLRRRHDIDIVLTDLKMPNTDGVALLREIKVLSSRIEVILMTGYGSVRNAVEAMKHGAADYITKPFDTNELLTAVGKIVQISGLRAEVSRLRFELREKYRFDNIVGGSPVMQFVYEKIGAAKDADSTVLVCGESGTGKELVAKAIHYNGRRAKNPFVPLNCAAIPGELVESELFGHKKGSFTGAVSDSPGLFRAAAGGTIFLDEILEMPYGTQARLLRVLQEKRIRPVGGTEEVAVDVRVIASTNQDIEEAIRKGRFREDLYYRLGVIRIEIPPLRDRIEDIPALVGHFIGKFNRVFQRTIKGVSEDALQLLSRYRWPGNVRELESVLENAFALGASEIIRKSDILSHVANRAASGAAGPGQEGRQRDVATLLESERSLLARALRATGGNKTRAAQLLGISRPRLYSMIRRHKIDP